MNDRSLADGEEEEGEEVVDEPDEGEGGLKVVVGEEGLELMAALGPAA